VYKLIRVTIVSLTIATSSSIWAGSMSVEHRARVSYDFAGIRFPQWSGGALVNFISNQTAAPVLLVFDDQGKQIQSLVFTIPGSELIDLDDIGRIPDGSLGSLRHCLRSLRERLWIHCNRKSKRRSGDNRSTISLLPKSARRGSRRHNLDSWVREGQW
jgi:hypothetical protein